MDRSVLQKYTNRADTDPQVAAAIDDGAPEDLGTFGYLRGIRDRAAMLELRRKTGDILAVGYAWIERVEYDPSQGITLHVAGKQIRITGRNLNAEVRPSTRLFEGITRHRVPWLRESTEAELIQAEPDVCIVTAIQW